MFRIAICDDELHVCSQLENILGALSKGLPKRIEVDVFYTGESLMQYLSHGEGYDLIFLDIELKLLNGVEVGKKIREELKDEITQIVYISGKDSYAMELFEVRPLNFLIKPLERDRIEAVVRKAIELTDRVKHFFEYKSGRSIAKAFIKDILYFESKGKKVRMVLVDGAHEFYSKLSEIEQQLDNQDFILIHKSYLANSFHIIEYQYESVKMSDHTILPISQQHRRTVREKLLQRRRKG